MVFFHSHQRLAIALTLLSPFASCPYLFIIQPYCTSHLILLKCQFIISYLQIWHHLYLWVYYILLEKVLLNFYLTISTNSTQPLPPRLVDLFPSSYFTLQPLWVGFYLYYYLFFTLQNVKIQVVIHCDILLSIKVVYVVLFFSLVVLFPFSFPLTFLYINCLDMFIY